MSDYLRMLQIVTGMYFRDVPLRETPHRTVFYTNGTTLRADEIELPIGRFLFSDGTSPVTAVTVEATERLEAVTLDGESEMLVSTGGAELLNDAATVFAFAMNLTCSRNIALVERLVPPALSDGPSSRPSNVLRRTFDPGLYIQPSDMDRASEFCTDLLALSRSHFEAAMRAIRRVIDATHLVGDDPSLAYTLFVTSLESLAQISTSPEEDRSWDTYDSAKRKVIEDAIADLTPEQADRVRDAVLEIDQLSLSRRFRSFVVDHIEPSFYRSEATTAIRPVRAHDLKHALRVAYELRSRNVHQLEVLAPELWLISDRADTLRSEGRSVLGLEGLNRLCRHVIRNFAKRSPKGVDTTFNYREYLPGRVKVNLAPQYWIWKSERFTPAQAPGVLSGLIELLLPPLSGADENDLVDLGGVLEKIESALPGEARSEVRRPMIAIYILWHLFMDPAHHRPNAAQVIDHHQSDLDAPSMVGFAMRLLSGEEVEWNEDELETLARERREELERGRGQSLPARFDAALLLCLSERVWEKRPDQARLLISDAVQLLPGDAVVMDVERAAEAGDKLALDLRNLAIGIDTAASPDDDPDRTSDAPLREAADEHSERTNNPTRNPRDDEK